MTTSEKERYAKHCAKLLKQDLDGSIKTCGPNSFNGSEGVFSKKVKTYREQDFSRFKDYRKNIFTEKNKVVIDAEDREKFLKK